MRAAQLRILRQHVRQSGRVRQQIEHTRLASVTSLEFGQIRGYGFTQRDLAALDQDHQRGRGHWLGDGGDEKHRIGLGRCSEAFVKYDGPAARHQDRSRSKASLANFRFQHAADTIESGARHPGSARISRPKLSKRRWK